jgi:hypothetical protein
MITEIFNASSFSLPTLREADEDILRIPSPCTLQEFIGLLTKGIVS